MQGQIMKTVYQGLLSLYGPQHWWPADSAFEVMIGAILTQNTAWSNVECAIGNLKGHGLTTARAILDCDHPRLAEALRPSGYFNIKADRLRCFCLWFLSQGEMKALRHWSTEQLRQALLAVKGIGPETADDMLLYAFDRPVFVIDAYTRRLFSRLGLIEGGEPYEQLRLDFEASLQKNASLFNEYHALIVRHGKEVCRPNPSCERCSLLGFCPLGS
ncbi:MAG: endonuclease III domain-containing protein [Gammaproteobacteria bacterium]|nr:endonuclease III domain-containing protein [Gammaproteobacteria bacterium]